MNCNWTGKLQVTLLSAHISRKKLCSETSQSLFGRSNCDVFWENEGNMHVGGCVIEVAGWHQPLGILQLHNRFTLSQTVFWDFK